MLIQDIPYVPTVSIETKHFLNKNKASTSKIRLVHVFTSDTGDTQDEKSTYCAFPWRLLESPPPPSFPWLSSPPTSIQLRDEQVEYVRIVKDTLDTSRTALLSLRTGGGKTVVALYLIAWMNVPTLILVHRQLLVDQWRERIAQFLPEATNIHVCIASSFHKSTLKTPTLLVVDEAHLFCAPTLFKVVMQCTCEAALALTATPERPDQRHKLLYALFGKPCVYNRVFREFTVLRLSTCFTFPLQFHVLAGERSVDWTSMMIEQSKHELRNEWIVQITQELMRKGYTVLVLSKFIEQSKFLAGAIPNAHYVEGTPPKDIPCLVGTYSKCSVGFDERITALVLATDTTGSFEQTMGRMFRTQLPPVVVDLVDKGGDHRVWDKHYQHRKKYYTDLGGKVVNVSRDTCARHIP